METPVKEPVHQKPHGKADGSTVNLSVVIVSYNVAGYLDHCLDSVVKSCNGFSHEIIVIDNASTDSTVEMVKTKYPSVVLIENAKNAGYSIANNQGIAVARGRYILFLNPDTIVPSNAFSVSLNFLHKNPDVGLVSLKMVNADGSFQPACRRGFPTPLTALYRMMGLSRLFPRSRRFGRYNLTFLDENQKNEVDAICGAYMMGPADVIRKSGGFDQDFFMYGEDIDICFKVKAQGYKVYYLPECEIIHFKGESSKKNRIQSALNFYNSMFIFSKKYFGRKMGFFPRGFLFLGIFLNALVKIGAGWGFKYLSYVIDIIIINSLLFISLKLKFGSEGDVYSYTDWNWYVLLHTSISISFILTFLFSGIYSGKPKTLIEYLKALFVAAVIFFSFAYFIPNIRYSRIAFAATCIGLFIVLPGWRLLFYPTAFRLKTAIARKKRCLIIGNGQTAAMLHKKLCRDREYESSMIGFIEEENNRPGSVPPEYIIGKQKDMESIVGEKRVNEIFLALSDGNSIDVMGLVNYCSKNSINLKIVQGMHGREEYHILDITMSESIIL